MSNVPTSTTPTAMTREQIAARQQELRGAISVARADLAAATTEVGHAVRARGHQGMLNDFEHPTTEAYRQVEERLKALLLERSRLRKQEEELDRAEGEREIVERDARVQARLAAAGITRNGTETSTPLRV